MPRDALFSANLAAMASREIFTFDGRRSGMGAMATFGDRVGDRVDPFLSFLVQLGLRKRKL